MTSDLSVESGLTGPLVDQPLSSFADVQAAYLLFFGRAPESDAITNAKVGLSTRVLVSEFVSSAEFQWTVIGPILSGSGPTAWTGPVVISDRITALLGKIGIDQSALEEATDWPSFYAALLSSAAVHEELGQILELSVVQDLFKTLNEMAKLYSQSETAKIVNKEDINNIYRLFLGRDPESDQVGFVHLGRSREDVLQIVLLSLEFKISFLEPYTMSGPFSQFGFNVSPSSDLIAWTEGFFSVDPATIPEFKSASTVGQLAASVLNDRLFRKSMAQTPLRATLTRLASSKRAPLSLDPDAERLQKLGFPIRKFPEGFFWQKYLDLFPKAGVDRWSALQYLAENGGADLAIPPLSEQGGDSFLLAMASSMAVKDDPYSAFLYDVADRLSLLSSDQLQNLADCYLRMRLPRRAMEIYERVAESGNAGVWTYANGVKSALQLQDFEKAYKLLELTQGAFGGEPIWRRCLNDVLESEFTLQSQAAKVLYNSGRREVADEILAAAVATTASRLETLEIKGSSLPADGRKRIVMLANLDLIQCKHYRVDQKKELLDKLDYSLEVYDLKELDKFRATVPGASAAIIYRQPAWPGVVRAILEARSVGVPTFYEIDDLIFDSSAYPDGFSTYGDQISKEEYADLMFGVPLFLGAMELCDYAIASTAPLAEHMRKVVRSKKAWVVSNGMDRRNERARLVKLPKKNTDEVVLFYGSGTKAHNGDFQELLAPALLELLASRPNIRLLIVGHLELDKSFDAFGERIIHQEFISDILLYWHLLQTVDVNISVLHSNAMNDSKSEIKWLEAANFEIPSVVSPTATYLESLTDGQNVLFADSVEAWREKLGRLIDDPSLRQDIGLAAKKLADAAFDANACSVQLEKALFDVSETNHSAAPRRPRILLCNVFFPPQTLGGATRVLRDNIDAWIDAGLAEKFDLAVFTTDEGVKPAGKTRVDSYRGLPVFRVSTPAEANMDWRPFNSQVGDLYGKFHAMWKPDLVHFHCVQRLTASVVEHCRSLGTPYIVTVHDAWWISDYQFLVDDEGDLVDPALDAPQPIPPDLITKKQSDYRRVRLRGLLNGAAAVIAVSNSFADLYRSAGIANVTAISNGVSPLNLVPHVPTAAGKVRLAQVGGISTHKGYDLIRSVISESKFSNLRLTVVDHRRTGGAVEKETWGSTEVEFVGKTPQEKMGEFYAQQDVLLAPSIWPESYGLVTREALSAGLWVVASDRGAIGEDVIPGQNGFVVDVSNNAELTSVLRTINRNPAIYLTAPPPTPMRSSAAQAIEVMELYEKLLMAT